MRDFIGFILFILVVIFISGNWSNFEKWTNEKVGREIFPITSEVEGE